MSHLSWGVSCGVSDNEQLIHMYYVVRWRYDQGYWPGSGDVGMLWFRAMQCHV